jgi:hypothetical protein
LITAQEQKRQVVEACAGPLEELGFRQQRTTLFVRELTDDILGCVSLGLKVYRDPDRRRISVTPTVGVRCHSLERLLAEINGQKFHRYDPPLTVSRLLGNLLPFHGQYWWSFNEPGGDPKATASRMVKLIGRYGLPYMQGLLSLASIHDALVNHPFKDTGGFLEMIPASVLLCGDRDAARSQVIQSLERFAGDRTLLAEEYRAFAQRFLAYTDRAPS